MKKISPLVALLVLLVIIVGSVGTIALIQSRAGGSTSSSKLGIFIQNPNGTSQSIIDKGPKVVKFLINNPNDFVKDQGYYNSIVNQAKSYKNKYPEGKVLLRVFDFWHSAKKYTDSIPADDAAGEIFDYYEPVLSTLRSRGDLKYFDFLAGPPNETERTPFWDTLANVSWLSRFWYTLTQLNADAGIKTCAGNILTGDFTTNSENLNIANIVLFAKLKETGGVLCYHGYPESYSTDAGVQREHPLHYRDFGPNSPQIIIGEVNIVDGWQKHGSAKNFEDWLSWYDGELKKDPKVIGATLYQVGGGGPYELGEVATWLASYLSTSSNTTPSSTNGSNQTCFNSCYSKTGNSSGCRYICDNGKEACFNSCVNAGTAAKTCITRCSSGNNTPPPPPSADNWIKIEDSDPRFTFTSNPSRTAAGYPHWDQLKSAGAYVLRGGTAQQCNGLNNAGCKATLDLSSEIFKFDSFKIGFTTGPNRTEADIYVDGEKIGAANSNASSYTQDYHNYKPWTSRSGSFECGKHVIKIVPNQRTGNGQKAFTLDYLDIHTCESGTATANPGTGKCQGNTNSSAKCFSCKKDVPTDQLNILDFACFANQYGKNVGIN